MSRPTGPPQPRCSTSPETAGTLPTILAVATPNSSNALPDVGAAVLQPEPGPGISLPNRVIANLGPNQDICVYSAAGRINFIVDVNGWFGAASAPAGAFFYSVPPTRVCDTRTGFRHRVRR